MKVLYGIAVVLVILTAAGTGWLVVERSKSVARTSDSTIAQADKLFKVMTDFQTELESVTGQANYPDDKDKETMKKFLRDRTLHFQMARLAYSHFKTTPSPLALLIFLNTSCPGQYAMGCVVVRPPFMEHYSGGTYDAAGHYEAGKSISYGNTSRLESLEDEFIILAISMLRELK